MQRHVPGVALAAALLAAVPAHAGAPEEVRVTLRLVDFLALDGKGTPIRDLELEEVHLWEDGMPMRLVSLLPSDESPASDAVHSPPSGEALAKPPGAATGRQSGRRWIVLLIGARDLSQQSRTLAAAALADLVTHDLEPTDRVSLMVDDDELRVLVPFTTRRETLLVHLEHPVSLSRSTRELEKRLEELRDNAASCRDTHDVVGCARQAAGSFVAETARQTETSLGHLDTLVRALGAIPDRKILLYVSDGLIVNPGDVGMAAVEHAVGQWGYNANAVRSLLERDYRPRLETLYQRAVQSRVGFFPVSSIRKMTDQLFSAEGTQDYGPENPPQARTDPFEATWEQVRDLHEGLARATGGVALFERDPKGHLGDLVSTAAGTYTLAYPPTEPTTADRKIKIAIDRPGAKAIHRKVLKSLQPDEAPELPGELVVEDGSYDAATRRVPVRLRVAGGAFAAAEGADPPVSLLSLFFEVRDAGNRPVQDLLQFISLPRGPAAADPGPLTYPFELQVPPGSYVLRVSLRDLNGPARGLWQQAFSVPREGPPATSGAHSSR